MSYLYNITNIELAKYDGKDISALSNLFNLSHIKFDTCINMTDINALSNLINLRFIRFSYCFALTDIKPLINLHNLTRLEIIKCNRIMDISPVSNLDRLKILFLKNCTKVNITPIHSMKNLSELHICLCYNNTTHLDELSHLYNLTIYKYYH